MLREIIEHQNRRLLMDTEVLRGLIADRSIPTELEPYRKTLLQVLNSCYSIIQRNLRHLQLGRDEILEDLLSETKRLTEYTHLLTISSPIMRQVEKQRKDEWRLAPISAAQAEK